ncbi:MAG: MogA/MoaB family molybdenum cofactor biosynthesis protein [Thermoprotei archaeon]|nr:MAG: MogA/MoaB family molybdenum cofactor biosynthesis protein [Thermoprotei archaeon]
MTNKPNFTIVVVSDSVYKGLKKDVSGEIAKNILEENGYIVIDKIIIPNSAKEIVKVIRTAKSDILLFIGGTGPSPRDITIDTIEALAWRKIPGFGELFRYLSYKEIGFRGIISRSELYILPDGRITIVLPGSVNAVKLGLKIIIEIIDHLYEEAKRFEGEHKIPHK